MQALEAGELVMVCGHCHKSLGGGLSVAATGEFTVPTLAMMAEDELQRGERVHSPTTCTWCGKLEAEVKKLLGRGNAALCNECVALASDVMEAELGSDWR
jgi:hypothetical protein